METTTIIGKTRQSKEDGVFTFLESKVPDTAKEHYSILIATPEGFIKPLRSIHNDTWIEPMDIALVVTFDKGSFWEREFHYKIYRITDITDNTIRLDRIHKNDELWYLSEYLIGVMNVAENIALKGTDSNPFMFCRG